MLPVIGHLRPWNDLATVAIGRLPMRAPLVAFPDVETARGADPSASPWYQDLSGTWSFRRYDHPDRVPAAAVGSTPPPGAWQGIPVPGTWVLHADTPDVPHYTNIEMPFPGPPPALPEVNPTGVHRTTFRLPRAWRGRQVVLHVGGAESVHAVYVDGSFVGYGTDAHLASEYDLTPHLGTDRVHHLAIVVMRYSAQSYVEDQDQWWMAGLHRGVHLEARAPVHVADLSARADWDGTNAHLDLDVRVGFVGSLPGGVPAEGWQVRAWCEGLSGRQRTAVLEGAVPHRFHDAYLFEGHRVRLSTVVPWARPWSAESPSLSRVVVELIDPNGDRVETVVTRVGFRRVEVGDRQLRVNGQAITIFGMNRHDDHPDRGHAVTRQDILDDLLAMKRLNVNAVRTSHYPNHPWLYDLCDELGFYVVDEADIEGHAYNTSLCHDPTARATWMERVARMVQRDRNHPSVIIWSLGNESGYGAIHDATAAWIRRTDPTRPLQYEGAIFHESWNEGGRAATDIVCPMYPPIDAIRTYAEWGLGDRPLIMCEYSHAMGNSNGSLADYWDVIDAHPVLQGGFIWEWKDHGLRQRLPDGRERFAYGGQFGDRPHDGNFVADGLVASDLTPHPAAAELMWVHRPVAVEARPGGRTVKVRNRRNFTGLDDLRGAVEVLVDGRVALRSPFNPEVAAAATALVALPTGVVDVLNTATREHPGSEVLLSFRWVQRRATPWAAAGHLAAWDQVLVRSGRHAVSAPRPKRARLLPIESVVGVAPALTLWRAAGDNDGFKLQPVLADGLGGGPALWRWLHFGLHSDRWQELVGHRHRVTRSQDGSEVHDHVVELPDELTDVPRVGVTFTLPPGFDDVNWYGRGPHECYPDRQRSAMLGAWSGEVDHLPYLVPQEHGLRTDCRWFTVSDGERTLAIEPLRPHAMHVSVTRYSAAELFAAADQTELPLQESRVVHVDVAHRGLGTVSCGPDVADEYRIPAGRFRFRYRLAAWAG